MDEQNKQYGVQTSDGITEFGLKKRRVDEQGEQEKYG